jgi:hypothetical protein
MLQTFAARRPSHDLRQIRTYQVATLVQSGVTLRAISVEHFPPFHHVAIAAVFLDHPLDVIAALAVALGAFDAEHVELAFDVRLEWFPPFPKYFVIQVPPNDLSVATRCVYATAIVAAPRVFDPVSLDTLFDQSLTNLRLGRVDG